jgi:hypothetical protein
LLKALRAPTRGVCAYFKIIHVNALFLYHARSCGGPGPLLDPAPCRAPRRCAAAPRRSADMESVGADATQSTSPAAGHTATNLIAEALKCSWLSEMPEHSAPQACSIDDLPEPSPGRGPGQQLFFAMATYRGLFPAWFPEDSPRMHVSRLSRMKTIALALRRFELSSTLWAYDELLCLMHGHLSCVVAWHKHLSDDDSKMERSSVLPPQPPLTMLEMVVDAFPSYDELRTFYLACGQRPFAVLDAVHRRLRWHEYYDQGDASLVPFEEQMEQIIGAFPDRPSEPGGVRRSTAGDCHRGPRGLLRDHAPTAV